MKDTENIIQKFRQKFKHSQFVNYSAIESWLRKQIPLIKAEAVRETAKDIREQVYHCLYDGQWIEKAPYEHFEASKINLTFLQRVIFEKYLQPKTQDSDKVRAERLLKLNLEKQLRCGDGGGNNTISHSVNCECERIDRELNKTQDSEAGDGYCTFHSFMGKRVEIKNCADCNINKIQESEAGGGGEE